MIDIAVHLWWLLKGIRVLQVTAVLGMLGVLHGIRVDARLIRGRRLVALVRPLRVRAKYSQTSKTGALTQVASAY